MAASKAAASKREIVGIHVKFTLNTPDGLRRVEEAHVAWLRSRFEEALAGAACVILGGTLPRNVPLSLYADLISMARARHVPVVFDADQPYLSAGLIAGPTYIKPNHHELEALAKQSKQTTEAVRARLTEDGGLDRIRIRIRSEKTLDFLYQQSA